eukprot:Nitzschia sp. Nitz4//scaffold16_size188269//109081//110595//NITZ4_001797-RA/size188269-processed-gene-0.20-mRNA-1//1//CDS//3329538535//687//frame0
MYTCGPTVYDRAHLGNFRAFLTYDILKRVLLYFGYNVHHICNITDVDDKILQRVRQKKLSSMAALTRPLEDQFHQDLAALNILPATKYPRATEHVQDMMEMIVELAERGYAYETVDGSWYFDTTLKEGYGLQLGRREWDNPQEEENDNDDQHNHSPSEGEATLAKETRKRHGQDFCLWKATSAMDSEDAIWEYPPYLSKGRPGWHLECSAMARRYLGDTLDIHGGGMDLQFPHHENEIAQSEACTGKKYCQCWVHNGFVEDADDGTKMSKRSGRVTTLEDLGTDPLAARAYRFAVIKTLYRRSLKLSPRVLEEAQMALRRVDTVMKQVYQRRPEGYADAPSTNGSPGSPLAKEFVPDVMERFETYLLDDLAMPRATACWFELLQRAEKELTSHATPNHALVMTNGSTDDDENVDWVGVSAILDALQRMDRVFGVLVQDMDTLLAETDGEASITIPEQVQSLVDQRVKARASKNWSLADSLRDEISAMGYQVQDDAQGQPLVTPI